VAVLVGALAVVLSIATGRLFIWPRTDEPRRTGAVVVFGRHDERIATGLRLVRQGLARTLVLTDARERSAVCRPRRTFEIVCLRPESLNTRGEARAASKLARTRGWASLTLVTSGYHVTRARTLLDRCYDGHLDVVAADTDASISRKLETLAHEWGGLIYAYTVGRSC
jgi:hypothetical protein